MGYKSSEVVELQYLHNFIDVSLELFYKKTFLYFKQSCTNQSFSDSNLKNRKSAKLFRTVLIRIFNIRVMAKLFSLYMQRFREAF